MIGGGPAGLAAAIAIRLRGFSCLVVDHRTPPIDKACGEGLMPDALRALRGLGIEIMPSHGAPFIGIRFSDGHHTVDAAFPDGVGVGVRRVVLHRLLVERAAQVGVELRWGATGTVVDPGTVQVGSDRVRCRWMIGADGSQSQVRWRTGLAITRRRDQRYASRRHYGRRPWSEFVEIYWSPHGQFYVTPVGKQEICVAFIARSPAARLEAALGGCPTLAARLGGAPITSRSLGALSLTSTFRHVAAPSVALVGDASGSVDAITGDGLLLAFRQAGALAAAIAYGRLGPYERAHRRIMRRPLWMARLLLMMDRWPTFGQRALPALAHTRALFGELLAVHVGARPRTTVLAVEGLRFGRRLLARRDAGDLPVS